MPKLSVAIITLNEAMRLPGCLASVSGLADEVLVVDSGSTDNTVAIAEASGARVIRHEWTGFAAQREFAIQNASGDWCLMLDADERVSSELRNAIAAVITQDDMAAYSIPFQTVMFGEKLLHGVSKYERHVRLFRRDCAHWVQKGSRDFVKVDGKTGRVRPPVIHEPCFSIADFLQSMNEKTSMMAWENYQSGQRFGASFLVKMPFTFFYRYILMLGFLDGWAGFLSAVFGTFFDFIANAKLLDMDRFARMAPEQGVPSIRSLTPGTPLEMEAISLASVQPSEAKTIVEMPVAAPAAEGSDAAADTADSAQIAAEIQEIGREQVREADLETTDVSDILAQAAESGDASQANQVGGGGNASI